MKPMGKWFAAVAVALAAAWFLGRDADGPIEVAHAPVEAPSGAVEARQAFDQRAEGRMVRVSGRVQRILADDRDGSPHQRFVIATKDGQTLLVAHNLDLAARLEGLSVGDAVEVHGEYEWNPQ